MEVLAEQFSGQVCRGMFDLYVSYDKQMLAVSSRDYTTFQMPFGALRLVTLPMGWTNSVPVFHDDVTFILKEEIPHVTVPYIDDVPIKGPKTCYELEGGGYETITANPGCYDFKALVPKQVPPHLIVTLISKSNSRSDISGVVLFTSCLFFLTWL